MSDGEFKKLEYPMPKLPKGKKLDPKLKRTIALARYTIRIKKKEERERRLEHRANVRKDLSAETAKERAERVNVVALDRIKRIRNAPTALGVKMLKGIMSNREEPFTEETRTAAAALLMDIALGTIKVKKPKPKDP